MRRIRTTKEKIFFGILFFAFSWVVIGDLVQFHLDLIYGKNTSDWHQPFTKAPKGAVYKKVNEKVKEDHSGAGDGAVLTFTVKLHYRPFITGYVYLAGILPLYRYFFLSTPLRAPPLPA